MIWRNGLQWQRCGLQILCKYRQQLEWRTPDIFSLDLARLSLSLLRSLVTVKCAFSFARMGIIWPHVGDLSLDTHRVEVHMMFMPFTYSSHFTWSWHWQCTHSVLLYLGYVQNTPLLKFQVQCDTHIASIVHCATTVIPNSSKTLYTTLVLSTLTRMLPLWI